MFKADASLFLSALSNINTSQRILLECKDSIASICSYDINVNKGFSENCKTWIDDSIKEVKDITSSIKNIKEELISLDPDFSHDYLQLMEQFSSCKIDVSGLTDEELNVYNIQKDIISREYNDTLLSILEGASEKGELDEELQLAYDIEKIKKEISTVKDFIDEMIKENGDYSHWRHSVLYPTSIYEKYNMNIRNFDGRPDYSQSVQYYFELNKLLIELDPNLTNEEKSAAISNFNEVREFEEDIMESTLALQYYTTRNKDESWYNHWAEKYIAAIDKKINYLNKLNNHQIDFQSKVELVNSLIAQKEDFKKRSQKEAKLVFLNLKQEHADCDGNIFTSSSDYYDDIFKIKKDLGIATDSELSYLELSKFERVLNYVGTISLSACEGAINVVEQISDGAIFLGGAVVGLFSDDLKNDIGTFIKEDISSQMYYNSVYSFNLNTEIAYGSAHEITSFFSEAVGTVALQFIPGGPVAMVVAHGLKGIGDKGEEALQDGEGFYTAFAYGFSSGTIEASSALVLYGKTKDGLKIVEIVSPNGEAIATKFIVSGGKEYLKEGVSVIIDGDYNFDEATLSAIQSMTTTAFNEFVVAPVVDKVTFKNKISYETLDPNINKVANYGDILDDNTDNGLNLFLSSTKKIALKTHKKLVNSNFINKVAKKAGSKFMSNIYDIGN